MLLADSVSVLQDGVDRLNAAFEELGCRLVALAKF